ncbi:MAG: hypothetical protein ACRECX_15105 [Methyloceanibacter sp.]|uniref:hypothetical protein n=1 Tax=Methyloceanibacter sp. TaxID=1965321 RepID=UPI003D6C9E9D
MTLRMLLFAPLLLAAVAASDADKDRFTSGVWQGDANYDEDGKFRDCTMTAESEKGVLLGFVISKDFDWGIVIADETRKLEVGARKAVLLLIDAREPIAAVAKVVDVHGILIPLANSDPVIEAMRHGKVLRIVTDGAEFNFKLTGTRDAIAALAACVTEHQGSERVQL